MKIFLILMIAASSGLARAQDWTNRYAKLGELVLAPLPSAPFPHPKRAEGHTYQGKLYSAAEHYSDNTVAFFIPKHFRETGSLDLVIHFHGWRNHVQGVLEHYQLAEQLCDSGRNAVLVVPQGPYDAPDSFDGKLEDPGGFKQFVDDSLAALRRSSVLKQRDFKLGHIILSGHSGGYQVISSILDCGGLSEPIKEVWLFDALYAQTPKFMSWSDHHAGRLIVLYTDHGGTLQETQNLINDLKVREAPFFSGEEDQVTASELAREKVIFLHSKLPHDDVLDKHRTFQRFLETSCLEKR